MPSDEAKVARSPPSTTRSRSSDGCSSGAALRRSSRTKTATSTAPSATDAAVIQSEPHTRPRSARSTTRKTPTTDNSAPSRSCSGSPSGSAGEEPTRAAVAGTSASAATSTNSHRQPTVSPRRPPTSGPMPKATANAVPRTSSARRSSWPRMVVAMTSIDAGSNNAAPRPCTERAPISHHRPGATRGGRRAGGEDATADAEDPSTAVPVTQPATEQGERGGDEEVGVHRPAQTGGPDVEVVGDRAGHDPERRGGHPDGAHRQHHHDDTDRARDPVRSRSVAATSGPWLGGVDGVGRHGVGRHVVGRGRATGRRTPRRGGTPCCRRRSGASRPAR